MLKAYFKSKFEEPAPFTHRLIYLANKSDLYDQKDIIDLFEPLNIEARYPSHKEQLMVSLNKQRCESILEQSRKLQLWIKQKL
ncbi:MAG: HEPN domain-containing protein [Bacteroidota bacterium]|nr:HEPN domain-containing protein [Bacteroidota bacterium]